MPWRAGPARVRPRGGLSRAYAGVATASYAVLDEQGLTPTHPVTGRFVDYVHVREADLRSDRVRLLRQGTPGGLNSDRRPLVVRLRLG